MTEKSEDDQDSRGSEAKRPAQPEALRPARQEELRKEVNLAEAIRERFAPFGGVEARELAEQLGAGLAATLPPFRSVETWAPTVPPAG
jgi:hypothetical protein